MNKFKIMLSSILLTSLSFSVGGIDILTSNSPSSIRQHVQQVNISNESVFYNPSSISFLEDGNHMYAGGYFAFVDYETNIGNNGVFHSDTPQLLPSFSYVYKKDKLAYYAGMLPTGQGGMLGFDVNFPAINDLDVTQIYLGGIFGVSYQPIDNLSMSLGGRYTYGFTKTEGNMNGIGDFETKADAQGIAPELGLFYRLNDQFDFGFKYLGETKMKFDGKVKEGNSSVISALLPRYATDNRKDLPSVISLGTSYKISDSQKIALGYNRILESHKALDTNIYGEYDDTSEYSIGFEQKLNDKTELQFGYTYGDKGENDNGFKDLTELDVHSFGVGVEYDKSENMRLSGSFGYNYYEGESTDISNVNYENNKDEITLGFGVEFDF